MTDQHGGRVIEWNDTLSRLRNNDPTLTFVDLSYIGLQPELIDQLAEAIRCNKYATTLKLSRNKIRDSGATALAYMLKQNTAISNLDLAYGEIGSAGAIQLADALLVNRNITTLSLEVSQMLLTDWLAELILYLGQQYWCRRWKSTC